MLFLVKGQGSVGEVGCSPLSGPLELKDPMLDISEPAFRWHTASLLRIDKSCSASS